MYIGVDGCSDGWIAVRHDQDGYESSGLYRDIEELWSVHGDTAESVLIDVPIGLREDSNEKRPCDDAARGKLSPKRHSSVFSVPVRSAVCENTYEEAKATQETRTDGSLGVQSWAISGKIAELDTFLGETEPDTVGTIREAHPEVCFWALNDESPTSTRRRANRQPLSGNGLRFSKPSTVPSLMPLVILQLILMLELVMTTSSMQSHWR